MGLFGKKKPPDDQPPESTAPPRAAQPSAPAPEATERTWGSEANPAGTYAPPRPPGGVLPAPAPEPAPAEAVAPELPGALVLDVAGDPVESVLDTSPGAYRPDSVLDGGRFLDVTIRVACLRGRFKRSQGGPRQDDVCLRVHPETSSVILAVSDGVGSAPRSDVGASLAVRRAVIALEHQLTEAGPGSLDWGRVASEAAWSLVEEHRRFVEDDGAPGEDALKTVAATLSAGVLTRADGAWTLRFAKVGDSPVLLLRAGELSDLDTSKHETGGMIDNRVVALPQVPEVLPVSVLLQPGDVVLIATDGWSDPVALGGTPVGARSIRALGGPPPDIVDYAYLVDFNQRTFDDDRTLIAIWLDAAGGEDDVPEEGASGEAPPAGPSTW